MKIIKYCPKKAYNASIFFEDVLANYYYPYKVVKNQIDLKLFAEFCKHIRNTYKIFCEKNDKEALIEAIAPLNRLSKLANLSIMIDLGREILKLFALLTIKEIEDINTKSSNRFYLYGYDLLNNTPESIWEWLKYWLEREDGGFIPAYEAFGYIYCF